MQVKVGVTLTMTPKIEAIVLAAEVAYGECAPGVAVVITSAHDGKHMPNSLHYRDEAVDLRTGHTWVPPIMSLEQVERIGARMRQVLGPDYDVVIEQDHIHAEHDPKKPKAA